MTASNDGTAIVWNLTNPNASWVILWDGHVSIVNSASFSPDGQQIVTASDDSTARLWDSVGRPLVILADHIGPVRSASFSPDGQTNCDGG